MRQYPETPCYIIHKDELEQGVEKLKNAMKTHWDHAIIGYSFKTNALPWVLDFMRRAGFYAEVVSEDEYDLAVRMGYDRIIYNGPVKGKRSFFHALEHRHMINLDSARELDWLEEYGKQDVCVGVRVNFDLETVCPGETSGGEDGGRFGFSYETGAFAEVLSRLSGMHIKVSGIHLHSSSKTRSLNIYRELARMACLLKREYLLEPSYVDIGGGFFGGMENKPQFDDYISCIRTELKREYQPEKTMLVVEPGTSLITPPIEYITRVVDCKDTSRGRFVVTDGSRGDIDPLHGKTSYFHKIYHSGEGRRELERQVICGYTCMENDRLFTVENDKELKPGDIIAYQKVGGYTMCLTPLFICYFPAVYVEENRELSCVREHWKEEEYIQKSHFADREDRR